MKSFLQFLEDTDMDVSPKGVKTSKSKNKPDSENSDSDLIKKGDSDEIESGSEDETRPKKDSTGKGTAANMIRNEAVDTSNLATSLKVVISNSYVMYFKAHTYHWNVEGNSFAEYHDFFGELYAEVYEAVDDIAEQMRAIDVYAPFSFTDMLSVSTVKEDSSKPADIKSMLTNLQTANTETVAALDKAFQLATAANNQGLINYLGDRLDKHAKHGWQLKASLKNIGE